MAGAADDPTPDPDAYEADGAKRGPSPTTDDDAAGDALLGESAEGDETAGLGDPDVTASASSAPADDLVDPGPYTDGPVPDSAEGTPDATADAADAEPDPLTQLTAERDDYLDQLRRSRADYENLNKRRHKEVSEASQRGTAALVENLLEVLDNFGFALQAAEASDDAQLAKGVQLVHGQLMDVLERSGLEEVPGVGAPFDPAHHEALMSEQDDTDRDEPEVSEVLRVGYLFKGRLLRPASVKVVE